MTTARKSHYDQLAHNIRTSDTATPDAEFSKEDFINVCMRIIGETDIGETPKIMLPVELPKDTKKNKARLITADRSSPVGVILKGDIPGNGTFSTAVGVFNAMEVMTWLFHQDEAQANA